MANRRDIKRRIGSVVNTQKITKAMKLVAAAKFSRASHAVQAARPYSLAFDAMVTKLVSLGSEMNSPLLKETLGEKKTLVVVLATDRGLCGGLNTNLFRHVRTWLDQNQSLEGRNVSLAPWGRKANGWAKKQNLPLLPVKEKVLERPNYLSAKALVDELVELFTSGEFQEIYLAYSQFVNALTQKAQVCRFLPVSSQGLSSEEKSDTTSLPKDLITEPGLSQMLDKLLQRKITALMFQAMLDGSASEHGSRMTAMDSATSNASEVRKKLTLKYNRARQAAITKELIEIISGAEAL